MPCASRIATRVVCEGFISVIFLARERLRRNNRDSRSARRVYLGAYSLQDKVCAVAVATRVSSETFIPTHIPSQRSLVPPESRLVLCARGLSLCIFLTRRRLCRNSRDSRFVRRVIATTFTVFKAHIHRWWPLAATAKEVARPSAPPPFLWSHLYWL